MGTCERMVYAVTVLSLLVVLQRQSMSLCEGRSCRARISAKRRTTLLEAELGEVALR